jgi:hypothetical protein
MLLFDAELGRQAEEHGMSVAALSHAELLELAQEVAMQLGRLQCEVTIDDVHRWLGQHLEGYEPSDLGNAAGSVFKGPQWQFVRWDASQRVSNHRRSVRVWRLRR